MPQPRSRQELYEIYRAEVQNAVAELTDWEDGSINNAFGGATSLAMAELVDLITLQFRKTFFNTADGPEITGSTDDLETLAVDHFGDDFARLGATPAVGVVTFSRPNSLAGDVLIPAGTIVKTDINALGEEQRFATIISLEMTGLTTNASVEAVVVGTKGNITAGEVTTIESALTDPTITVTNAADFAGGEPEQDDATYREYIRNLIQQLKGATKEAIEAKLLTVPGVEQATVIEFLQTVIEWDDPNDLPIGDAFTIPRVKAFIADANGTANQALIDAAQAAATTVRACGVRIDVLGATPVTLNWTATIALNPSGPNYAELSTDTSMIEDSMAQYIQDLEIGDDFVRALANQAMLAIWGPSGTDDLTNFVTVAPSGDVTTAENERLIPGTMDIS